MEISFFFIGSVGYFDEQIVVINLKIKHCINNVLYGSLSKNMKNE